MSSIIMVVTPNMAEFLLMVSDCGDALNTERAHDFADKMRQGKFSPWTPALSQPVMFHQGRLINGQHRMHAVVLADIPVAMEVSIK